MKSYNGDFIWSAVEHGNSKEKFYEKEYYLKEDADKVIEYLQNQLSLARTSLIKSLAKAQHEARYQKYKRCLKNAESCMHKTWYYNETHDYDDANRMWKWRQRWLELAKQFNSKAQ